MLIDIPNYVDEHRKTKVPTSKLQDDDQHFRAIRIGPITLVAKVYWRIVHY